MKQYAEETRTDGASATSIRQTIHEHLVGLGFSANGDGYAVEGELSKQRIRDLHAVQREETLGRNRAFVDKYGLELVRHFATGSELDPAAINPELVEVRADSAESRLFRLATLLWSIPVSQGFGRRLRFLVRDRQNGCLIGLLALGDPVFNLTARDEWIGWSHRDRLHRLVHVMDAYVVGAVPPYSCLLGGKLVAALMASREVKQAYERKYLGRQAVISKKENRARLVLLTTTSALGRSSLYNRLAIADELRFVRVGATRGFGHFHLSGRVFEALRAYLSEIGHPYAYGHRFGMGPNWKIRVVRTALEELGIDANGILKHGVQREVYAVPLATNYREVLLGQHGFVRSKVLQASEISSFCLKRWIMPRASRDRRYEGFEGSMVMNALVQGGRGPEGLW